jgi:hypothetical protein
VRFIADFIRNIWLKKAAQLMENEDGYIIEVMYRAGIQA